MIKFILQALILPAAYLFLLFYYNLNAPCEGLGCVGNGLSVFLGMGILLVGSAVVGAFHSAERRWFYSKIFLLCSLILCVTAVLIFRQLNTNIYKVNEANKGEAEKFGINLNNLYLQSSSPETVVIPESPTGNWVSIDSACSRAGYNLSSSEGKTVSIYRYASYPHPDQNIVAAINKHYDVICLYQETKDGQIESLNK